MNAHPDAVCLFGPTATGKTAVSLDLARRLPVDIISVDSAMVYRHMDIGSGKPPPEVRRLIPHRLIDIRNPWEQYSAGAFVADARAAIAAARSSGRIPLLVGGTLLYFRSLLRGLAPLPAADPRVRADLERQAADEGWPALHRHLARVDPEAAARIAPGDRQRIQRALEVWILTGRPLSALQNAPGSGGLRFLRIGIVPEDRRNLHRAIEARFDGMLAGGFREEVERLLAMPAMSADRPALRAVGYRQLCEELQGRRDRASARLAGIAATRQLAKRQLTWLRSESADHLLPMECGSLAADVAAIIERCFADAIPSGSG